MEAAQVSTSRGVDKTKLGIYTMDYYSSVKKKILPFVTVWMDVENIVLSKIRERQICDFTHMWNLMKKLN